MSVWIVARVEMLSTAKGGRQAPFVSGGVYRPQLHVTGTESSTSFIVHTIDGDSELAPGDSGICAGWLLAPEALESPISVNTMFVLNEGNRAVGTGVVLEVKEATQ